MHANMNGIEVEPTSMEHIRRSDVFPKKLLVSEDDNLRVPFPLLSGECAEYLGRTADGIVVLSNYRLLIRYKESFINVPLGLIEGVETREIFYLHAYCKDATVVRCAFSTNEACQDWFKRLLTKIEPQRKIEDVFAFCFHAWCADHSPGSETGSVDDCYQLCPQEMPSPYNFTAEVERMEFNLKNMAWRYTDINKNFGLCSSYPTEHIVPSTISDENLKKVAGFRALYRFPTVVWRNCRNGAVLVRSSQPEMGFFGWRNTDDENLLSAIPLACAQNPGSMSGKKPSSRSRRSLSKEDGSGSDTSSEDSSTVEHGLDEDCEPKKMMIIDCRSYTAAFANRAKGGGVECTEYYTNCEIQFMNLANIHAVRKSFLALRILCSSVVDQASWLSGLENTKWLHNIASLLKAATLVSTVNEKEGRPVLVHCSDGWDRTPQIISLAELILDPYYRTVQGFQVLVAREWLQFGHKFADRCGNGTHTDDMNERCPVFLQWLECVYQLTVQFPCQFEFNEALLVKLVQHAYSCMFGTFLCNTLKERRSLNLEQKTASVWSLLSLRKFYNHLYAPSSEHEVLYPATHVQSLKLWTSVYLSNNSSFAGPEDTATQTVIPTDSGETPGLQKTRSCENLLLMNELNTSLSRRKSDPNIAMDHCEQQAQKLLKDAIGGDTSCSSESMKSSENDRSLSENGENTMNGLDSPSSQHSVENGVLENGHNNSTDGDSSCSSVENNVICDTGDHELDNGNLSTQHNEVNGDLENGDLDPDKLEGQAVANGDSSDGDRNGLDDLEHTHTDIAENGETAVEENGLEEHEVKINGFTNGHNISNVDITNGNGLHEMNGHTNSNSLARVNSPDSAHDSSENSIETISEGEECDTVVNGANSHENGIHMEPSKLSKAPVSSNFNNGDNSDIDSRVISMKLRQRSVSGNDKYTPSMESSTDTVTEDLQNGDSSHTLTPSNSRHTNKVASLQSLCDKKVTTSTLNSIDNTISISTSTSDLTDSRIHEKFLANGLPQEALLNVGDSLQASLKLRCILSQPGLVKGSNGTCKGMKIDTSVASSLQPTPVSPQSRNSTCPPTPGTCDGRSLDTQVPRCGLSRHLDVDGLTKFNDPVQQQIDTMQNKYEQEISRLKNQVSTLQALLAQHASACNGDICNLDFKESPGSCDMQSIQSNYSNAASDASWDQMDDPEVNIVRWVPDHTVTHCAACYVQFTVLRRKHHCRNCGKIFCHSCSQETVPLPHQMIDKDERVCQQCYHNVIAQLTHSIIEMDCEQGAMAAAASN